MLRSTFHRLELATVRVSGPPTDLTDRVLEQDRRRLSFDEQVPHPVV